VVHFTKRGEKKGRKEKKASAQYSYDSDSRLTDLTYGVVNNSTWQTFAGYHWSYDADSRVTDEYSRADASGTTNGSYTTWAHTAYTYDQDSQLTGTAFTGFAHAPNSTTTSVSTSESQTYDANGNRATTADTQTVSGGGTTTNSSTSPVSSTNQLLFDGTYYYQYDAAGNRTAKYQLNGSNQPINITGYTWNNANELVAVKQYSSWSN
jgi:hypothetical protein